MLVGGVVSAPAVSAQELVYTPVNPSFGGNPFNSSHLLGVANAQDDTEPPSSVSSSDPQADLFIRQLQSRLLSGLASEVANAIFGDDPQDYGRVVFGDQTVEFERGLDSITLTIFDATTGSTTEIVVPIFTTGG
ncbi:curli production assembly/transport component CsgF [Hyphomonas adhaerens MHS-3]|uniref:Curli production assembly/transport component CsgF n=2 Tax=Hyphomonas adhaerens TaxID=81029 RepID=A0A069E0D3_9PROT|nr:curli production assembly/transport component CsgF [Hyphomonas adhaerens MHS-3]